MIPNYSLTDVANGFLSLLPDWLAWNKEAGTVLNTLVYGLAPTHYAITQAGINMPANSFPTTCTYTLQDWQNTFALGPTGTQAQIAARLGASFDPTVPNFQTFVGNLLGCSASSIYITQYYPFIVGFNNSLNTMYPLSAAFTWQISIPVAYASQETLVASEVARLMPAHSILLSIATH